ncbi:ATP-binding protein [Lewinella sp. LCG006]|uniref:sensor histidine kinase n=1 Tax=Lewinella sp. LCG006 TaxID=3231911 RepID=UPI0034606071
MEEHSDNQSNTALQHQLAFLRKKERHLTIINNFATSLLRQNTVEEIIWSITTNVIAKLGFVDCVVYLLDEDRQVLVQKAAHGEKNPAAHEIINCLEIPFGKGIVGYVAQSGKSIIIKDTSTDSRYIFDDALRFSELAVPIILDGKVIGVIDSEHPERNFFTNDDLYLLETVAAMSASRISHAQAQEKLHQYRLKLEELVESRTSKLRRLVLDLRRSNKDLEQYAHAASHDLKEPVRTIASFLSLIKRRKEHIPKEETEEYLDFAIDAARRMEQLLNGLLDYAKISDTNHDLTAVDLNSVLENVKRNLSVVIADTQATICYPYLPIVAGFETLLAQFFQNLIANAIKFHRPNHAPSISLTFTKIGELYHFKFQDNGIGIEPQYADSIFKLFTRLNNKEDFEGNGLGLSLCRRIIEKHGGEISVNSKGLGYGTTFSFSLHPPTF